MTNYFLYFVTACFWGGSFIAIKPLVEVVPPVYAAALRVLIAVVFLVGLLPFLKVPYFHFGRARYRIALTGQFAFTIPFALLFWGEQRISPGLAGILNGTVPLFVFLIGAVVTPGAEVVNKRRVAGLLFGLVGLVVIFYPQLVDVSANSLEGTIAVTFMAVAYAISTLLNRGLFTGHPEVHPFTNLFQQLGSSLVVILPLAYVVSGPLPELAPTHYSMVLASSLYLGVGSTSIAFVLFYKLIQSWGAVRASTVTYLIPLAALFFDFLMNQVKPSGSETLGVLIVTIGVVTLNWPNKK
jgi:drug/metabolite transporter (DMT)-like permease